MAKSTLYRYYVDIRLSKDSDHRKSFHIDACSEVGAMTQALKLLKQSSVYNVYALTIRSTAYPVAKRKMAKALKEQNKTKTFVKDNLKTISDIKTFLDKKD